MIMILLKNTSLQFLLVWDHWSSFVEPVPFNLVMVLACVVPHYLHLPLQCDYLLPS